ncbi:hypothetical protein IQ37_00005 [Chryseobacterium piperi]|uniref:Sel1 repeat family protein n=1 Tax=Chryseobacterium piperi TaxID=558152 RepID=A0A086BMP5_9FLAO|nr:tetratricopeptide repeat protein [Chryseobacterium piperi]ASW75001.1 sel1 repeat family protein [Chryseobacterium piperi]KFF30209.1 hypothetical protein IQ37_00005 [Chryseobacterium piperi]
MNQHYLTALLAILLALSGVPNLSAQQDSSADVLYKQGLSYKNGTDGKNIDFAKAYDYFSQAAQLNYPQGVYSLAYMHFKGLSCQQDYVKAAGLFKQGALAGRDNSMYFLGLIYRNGYGIPANEDSAKYWLQKAADMGYKQAIEELKMQVGENSNVAAKALAAQIQNAALPANAILDHYVRIEHKLPGQSIITGDYNGYLLQYDWSGQNIVDSKSLNLHLADNNGILTGTWTEEGTDSVAVQASLEADSLRFSNTQYRRKDHYSPDTAILYNFNDIVLNLVQKNDSTVNSSDIDHLIPD